MKNVNDDAVNKINREINIIAKEFNIHVIDLNSSLGKNWEYFMIDGIHPNEEGKNVIANTIINCLDAKYFYLDREYWQSVQDYEEQKRLGWFGCDN